MIVRKSDFIYLAAGIVLALVGVMAAINPTADLSIYALAGLGGIVLAVAIILNPVLGASILIIAIFTNISDLMTKQSAPGVMKPLVFLVAGAIAVHYASHRQTVAGRSRTGRIEIFLFLYFMVVAASYLVASDKDVASTFILDFAKDLVIVYSLQFALRDVKEWKQAAWVMMGTTAALCLLALYQAATGNYNQTFYGMASYRQDQVLTGSYAARFGGPINAPNMWGQVIVAVMPFVIYRIIYTRKRILKLVGLLFVALMLFVVFNTYSRGAYLALALVIFLIMLDFRLNPMLFFGALGVLIIGAFALPGEYTARLETLTALSPGSQGGIYQDSSLRGRSSEMLTGLQMFITHPLLGLGSGNYKPSYQEYAQIVGIETRAEPRDPHSLYIQVLAETGILGFITFMGFVISLLAGLGWARKAMQGKRGYETWLPWVSASRLSIISYLTTSIFLHNAYIRYFWILAALAIVAIQLTQRQLLEDIPSRERLENLRR
jgi:O-antigen ligase